MTPAQYVRDLSDSYERLHTQKEDAFWTAYMGLAEDADAARKDLDEKEIALKRFVQDPERLKRTRAELLRAEAEGAPADARTSLRGWIAMFEANVIESAEARALSEEIIEMEGRLARARGEMELGYRTPAEGFVRASSVKLAVMISNDGDEARRRGAWEGLRSIEPFVLDHGFLEIVRKRNRLGRLLGGEDYYDWRTKITEGMAKREIFALLDELERKTREHARRTLDEVAREHGRDALRPWNIRYKTTGDVTNELDPYFPFGRSLERWGRSFAALGIGYRGASLVLDLVDRKGKFENGFCHGPVPAWRRDGVWRPARVQFTANAIPGMQGAGKRATATFFHEGGHAAHFANVDMPAPCFAQEFAPTSVAFAETQSMFLDSLLDDAEWQARYARTSAGEEVPAALVERVLRATQALDAWVLRSMFTVCYAERALYEIPDRELTADRAIRELRKWERELALLEEGSTRPSLSVPHLLSGEGSAYYHGYILALMAVHQTRNFFLRRDGHLTDNPRIGPELSRAYWREGNARRFPEFVRVLTNEEVSPAALAARVNRTPDEAVAEARAAVERMGDVPEFTAAIDLDAQIRIVHGHEEVASTSCGFEPAADAFARWIGQQEEAFKTA